MIVALVIDRSTALRERDLLARLEVGLADEGVRVAHAIPLDLLADNPAGGGLYSATVGYEPGGIAFTRRLRAARLADAIQQALDLPDRRIDIVHAFGADAWFIGIELARQMSAGLLLELFDAAQIGPATTIAARRVGVRPVEFSVPEPVLRRALRKRAHNSVVHVAPWGVHAPPAPPTLPPRPSNGHAFSVALLADGRSPALVKAAMEGLAAATRSVRDTIIFAGLSDANSPSRPAGAPPGAGAAWAAARQLDMLDQFSLIPDPESRREPILQLDMLLVPEASGRQRTLFLDAMAAGVAIVAAADELVESLIDGRTARLVAQPTAAAWAAAISAVLNDHTAALARSAHEYVRAERTASAHVAAVMTAYNAMTAAAQVGVKM